MKAVYATADAFNECLLDLCYLAYFRYSVLKKVSFHFLTAYDFFQCSCFFYQTNQPRKILFKDDFGRSPTSKAMWQRCARNQNAEDKSFFLLKVMCRMRPALMESVLTHEAKSLTFHS